MRANVRFDFTASHLFDPADVLGVWFTGFTKVKVYDGADNTGKVLFDTTVPLYVNFAIPAKTGLYVEVTGSGSGVVYGA